MGKVTLREAIPVHGPSEKDTETLKTEESWDWLSKGNLKSERESLLIGAQDQALNTNSVPKNIYHQVESDRCRLCGETVANVTHIVSGCKMPAEKDYKWRYDKVCFHLHWCLSKKYGLDVDPSIASVSP